jgi:uncharacterized protein (DUF362 family)
LITAALGAMTPLRAAAYKVAVAYGSDPYVTAARAIAASAEFPNVSGKTVVIKPNLVVALPSSTGCISDPQVVRAVVDLALSRGAAQVIIAESPGLAGGTVPFAACGYEPLLQSRVSLLDFGQSPFASVPVHGGYVYRSIILPAVAADPSTVWISVAKMKVHGLTTVTLGLKNSFGLFLSSIYGMPPMTGHLPRVDPHFRGIDQSIVDVHIARPIDFTVIDGIIGMEWTGPTTGVPKNAGCIVAGRNTVACDRVAMKVMAQGQNSSIHVSLASFKGLGPASVEEIEIVGDPFVQVPFTHMGVVLPPTLWPVASPQTFPAGGSTRITFRTYTPSYCRLEVYRDADVTPGAVPVRTLMDWQWRPAGNGLVDWNGRNDQGEQVPAGEYMIRLRTKYRVEFAPKGEGTASNFVRCA